MAASVTSQSEVLNDPTRTWAAFDRLFDTVFSPRSQPQSQAAPSNDSDSDETLGLGLEGLDSTPAKSVDPPSWDINNHPLWKARRGSGGYSHKYIDDPPAPVLAPPPARSPQHKTVRKQRSKVNFYEHEDSRGVTAIFDLPGIRKEDVHVSFQTSRLVVTWETVSTTERREEGRIVRERREKKYIRTIPLADGTKFEDIKATMTGHTLSIIYPKIVRRESPQLNGLQISIY